MSRPVCQRKDCDWKASVTIPGHVLGVGIVLVRLCDLHAGDFLKEADGACLEARLAIARKRT